MKKTIRMIVLVILSLLVLFAGYFLVIRKLDADLQNNIVSGNAVRIGEAPVLLPVVFIDGARFCIKVKANNGDTLLAYGDTGGGISMLLPAGAEKLKPGNKIRQAFLKGVVPVRYIALKDISTDSYLQAAPLAGKALRTPFALVETPLLIVPSEDGEIKAFTATMQADIFLGQNFFMNRAWTFDYPGQQVWVNTELSADSASSKGFQKIGLKKNIHGISIYGHPSFSIEVNGEKIDMLFDTGASIVLSEEGKKQFNAGSNSIAGSFIASSVFDRWRSQHPDWKYFPKKDNDKNDIIEVPSINISGFEVGPVLFAKRPDEVWSKQMIYSMDKIVKGAIGGSALRFFKVTIDYRSEIIRFQR